MPEGAGPCALSKYYILSAKIVCAVAPDNSASHASARRMLRRPRAPSLTELDKSRRAEVERGDVVASARMPHAPRSIAAARGSGARRRAPPRAASCRAPRTAGRCKPPRAAHRRALRAAARRALLPAASRRVPRAAARCKPPCAARRRVLQASARRRAPQNIEYTEVWAQQLDLGEMDKSGTSERGAGTSPKLRVSSRGILNVETPQRWCS